jgi:hypothetical protein
MKKLILLKKERGCGITGIVLPIGTKLYAEHIADKYWHIYLGKNNSLALSVIKDLEFEFVN